ncbi:Six-hairpin glycosidase-like protein [Aspergillus cavernicola]|uniref:glucan 1,4-alpha-glucosidase n=1 Tax=Aspergillus cavernicola TaxID=176166 RepID=A0ABR4IHI6_9EURO
MLLKPLVALNMLAGAVVASPDSTLHAKKARLEAYIQNEKTVALQGVLNNFGPNGSLCRGAAPGVAIAGNSETNPPYIYTWTRDTALTVMSLIGEFLEGNSSLEQLIQQYITASAKMQTVTNPSGSLSDGAGLGEPKYNINITAFNDPWGRPQRDGPALRASALIAYGNHLLAQGQQAKALDNVWPVVSNDLAYVGEYWNGTGFDLWEEVNGSSFFTTAAQYKALVEGESFATALGKPCDACTVAPEILCHLQDYWNGTAVISNYPTNGRSGVDINSVITSITIFDPAATCDDATFQPCSARALANHKVLIDGFRSTYGVNKGREPGEAAAVGRYTEDIFMGGNPWYLATLASAEQLYDALYQWDRQGSLSVTELSLPFFRDLVANVKTGVYPKSTRGYKTITDAVRSYADGFISVVREYTPTHGGLSEEYHRDTGVQVSAPDLTWSYASFLTAIARRNGSVPPSWSSSVALTFPQKCNPTTVKGAYATATPSPW